MKYLTVVGGRALSMLGFAHGAQAQQAGKLFFEGDIERGNQAGAPGPACVLNNQFQHLEKVVWRMRVLDADRQALDDKGLKSLEVQLPDGQKLHARYGAHPPPRKARPTISGRRPGSFRASYPTGTFAYKVVATDCRGRPTPGSRSRSARSQLTVIAGDDRNQDSDPERLRHDARRRQRTDDRACLRVAGRAGRAAAGRRRRAARGRARPGSRADGAVRRLCRTAQRHARARPGRHADHCDRRRLSGRAGVRSRLAHREGQLEGHDRRISRPRVHAGRLSHRHREERQGRPHRRALRGAGGFRFHARHRGAAGQPPAHAGRVQPRHHRQARRRRAWPGWARRSRSRCRASAGASSRGAGCCSTTTSSPASCRR